MTSKAAIQNPYLKPFDRLIGSWRITGNHPYIPDVELDGMVLFEWVENGAFLKMTMIVDHPQIPDGISLFGSDNNSERLIMLYFDEREVSRIYNASFEHNELRWWRDDPEFSQRFIVTIEDDGETMNGKGEMCRDTQAWEDDLSLMYARTSK